MDEGLWEVVVDQEIAGDLDQILVEIPQFPVDWRLLIEEHIANIARLDNLFFVLKCFWGKLRLDTFCGFLGLLNPAYCAGGGSVVVAKSN